MNARPCSRCHQNPAASGRAACEPCLANVNEGTKDWYRRNREKKIASVMRWKATNHDKVLAAQARYRAKKRATPEVTSGE